MKQIKTLSVLLLLMITTVVSAQSETKLNVVVKNDISGNVIAKVKVNVINEMGELYASGTTDLLGKVTIPMKWSEVKGKRLTIQVNEAGYDAYTNLLELESAESNDLGIFLVPQENKVIDTQVKQGITNENKKVILNEKK